MRARMHRGQRRDLQRVEHAEDVELSFLRQVRRVGEEREGDVHCCNIDRVKAARLLSIAWLRLRTENTVTPGPRHRRRGRAFGSRTLSLVLMALIWGVNFSVVKFGTALVDPLAYNGVRVALAAVVLVLDRRGRRPHAVAIARATCSRCSALGVLGNGIYQFFFVEGHRADERERRRARRRRVAGVHRDHRTAARRRAHRRAAAWSASRCRSPASRSSCSATRDGDAGSASLARRSASMLVRVALLGDVHGAAQAIHRARVRACQLSALTMLGGAVPLRRRRVCRRCCRAQLVAVSAARMGRAVLQRRRSRSSSRTISGITAFGCIGPTRTAMYSNLQPVIAVLVAWAMLGETPTPLAGRRRGVASWAASCSRDIVKLVLFDIDGTILLTDGAGKRAIHRALLEVFGSTGPDDHRFDGKTDPQIVRELMRIEGHADEHIDERHAARCSSDTSTICTRSCAPAPTTFA